MKRNKIKLFCITLMLLLCMQGCIMLPVEEESTTLPDKLPPIKPNGVFHAYENTVYTYLTQVDENLLLTGQSERYLMLVNKNEENALGAAYFPSALTLVTVPTKYEKEIQLEPRAARALELMYAEMLAAGVTDVMVTSAYRSFEYQQSLMNTYLNTELSGISEDAYKCLGYDYIKTYYLDQGKDTLSPYDAITVVRSYSAEPGKSEHQTGLCVDLITADMEKLTEEFENTPAFEWLSKNAHQFGFILRYPKGKEDVTGYTYEPWHFRFVGREAATNMYLEGLTLEEYLALWKEQ